MLMRSVDLSGRGGSAATGGAGACGVSAVTGSGMASGIVVQAAVNSSRSAKTAFVKLVTEPDTHHVDLRCSESTSGYVEFVKIINRTDVDAVVIAIIDACALHA